MDLIVEGKPEALKTVQPKIDKVVRLENLGVFDRDLLFDIKRVGDQEQMRVSNARGITGDRLAAVFREALTKAGNLSFEQGIPRLGVLL
jgi:hypothetical protein